MTKKILLICAVILLLLGVGVYVWYSAERANFPPTGGEAESTDWEILKAAVMNCEVEGVFQTHSLNVTAEMKDGRVISATEPTIDDIFDVTAAAEPKCGRIIMATE